MRGFHKLGEVIDSFKVIITVMLFYSVAITLITYAMPVETLDYVTSFSDVANTIDLNGTSALVQDSLTRQTSIPVVELGAMVFYSGNIIIDLLLNFAFAIPQMISLFIYGIFELINVDTEINAIIQIFASVAVLVWYIISLIQLLTSVRSGRVV